MYKGRMRDEMFHFRAPGKSKSILNQVAQGMQALDEETTTWEEATSLLQVLPQLNKKERMRVDFDKYVGRIETTLIKSLRREIETKDKKQWDTHIFLLNVSENAKRFLRSEVERLSTTSPRTLRRASSTRVAALGVDLNNRLELRMLQRMGSLEELPDDTEHNLKTALHSGDGPLFKEALQSATVEHDTGQLADNFVKDSIEWYDIVNMATICTATRSPFSRDVHSLLWTITMRKYIATVLTKVCHISNPTSRRAYQQELLQYFRDNKRTVSPRPRELLESLYKELVVVLSSVDKNHTFMCFGRRWRPTDKPIETLPPPHEMTFERQDDNEYVITDAKLLLHPRMFGICDELGFKYDDVVLVPCGFNDVTTYLSASAFDAYGRFTAERLEQERQSSRMSASLIKEEDISEMKRMKRREARTVRSLKQPPPTMLSSNNNASSSSSSHDTSDEEEEGAAEAHDETVDNAPSDDYMQTAAVMVTSALEDMAESLFSVEVNVRLETPTSRVPPQDSVTLIPYGSCLYSKTAGDIDVYYWSGLPFDTTFKRASEYVRSYKHYETEREHTHEVEVGLHDVSDKYEMKVPKDVNKMFATLDTHRAAINILRADPIVWKTYTELKETAIRLHLYSSKYYMFRGIGLVGMAAAHVGKQPEEIIKTVLRDVKTSTSSNAKYASVGNTIITMWRAAASGMLYSLDVSRAPLYTMRLNAKAQKTLLTFLLPTVFQEDRSFFFSTHMDNESYGCKVDVDRMEMHFWQNEQTETFDKVIQSLHNVYNQKVTAELLTH